MELRFHTKQSELIFELQNLTTFEKMQTVKKPRLQIHDFVTAIHRILLLPKSKNCPTSLVRPNFVLQFIVVFGLKMPCKLD
jgi:hypothetical protein